jgi:hypothetical protein
MSVDRGPRFKGVWTVYERVAKVGIGALEASLDISFFHFDVLWDIKIKTGGYTLV